MPTTKLLYALAVIAAPCLLAGGAMAQGTLGSGPCQGTATNVNGTIQTQLITPASGADGTCEVLVMPDGRMQVQNGIAADDTDGPAAPHTGAGGAR
jgi:hypothetical protein